MKISELNRQFTMLPILFILSLCCFPHAFGKKVDYIFVNKFSSDNVHSVPLTALGEYGSGNIALSSSGIYLHGSQGSGMVSSDLKTFTPLTALQNATLVSDLTNQTLYALLDDNGEYMYSPGMLTSLLQIPSNISHFSINSYTAVKINLSEPIWLGYDSAIFSSLSGVLIIDGYTKQSYDIDLIANSGNVTKLGKTLLRWRPSSTGWITFGIREYFTFQDTSILYGNYQGMIERQEIKQDYTVKTMLNTIYNSSLSLSLSLSTQTWYIYEKENNRTNRLYKGDISLIELWPTSQPSSQPSVQPSTQPTSMPSLAPAAPKILTMSLNTSSTSVTITTSLDTNSKNPGIVYCAAFLGQNYLLSSSNEVIAKGIGQSYESGASIVPVKLTGLIPLMNYTIYCYVETSLGIKNTLQDVKTTKHIITTQCCKSISFINTPSYIYADSSKYKGSNSGSNSYTFTYSLSYAPYYHNLTIVHLLVPYNTSTTTITTTPTALRTMYSANNITVLPKLHTFSIGTTLLTTSFILNPKNIYLSGRYKLVLYALNNTTSSSVTEYYPIDTISLQIISSIEPPPAPKLVNAFFGDTGIDMYINFDSATDYGGLTYGATNWKCNTLLTFKNAEVTDCIWMNSTTIRSIFNTSLSASMLLTMGDSITVKANKIRPSCTSTTSTSTNCASYPYTSITPSLAILSPYHPVIPMVILKAPLSLGGCDDLLLDASGSNGNGGRDWSSIEWIVTESTNTIDTTAIMTLLNTNYHTNIKQVIRIARNMLYEGKYSITLKLSNFFNQLSKTTITISVSGNIYMPQLSILSNTNNNDNNNLITVSSANTIFQVKAQALFSTCNTTTTSATNSNKVVFVWSLYSSSNTTAVGVLQTSIKSTSRDPSIYLLPSNSLTPGQIYTLVLNTSVYTTTNSVLRAQSSISKSVIVLHGQIIAMINGGSMRQIAIDKSITLDARMSYDEDTGTSSGLTFSWYCIITSTNQYGNSCNTILSTAVTDTPLGTAILTGSLLSLDTTYAITVIVSSQDGRSASQTIAIEPLPIGSPYAKIVSSSTIFNLGSNLTLNAYVQSNTNVSVTWKSFINGQNISFTAYSPLNQQLASDMVSRILLYSVVLNTADYVAGSVVAFRILVNQLDTTNTLVTNRRLTDTTGLSAYSEVTLKANAPPAYGSIIVDPLVGNALITNFYLLSTGWIDDVDSYPLVYSFFYSQSPLYPKLTIIDKNNENSISTTLPSGLSSYYNYIFIQCTVYDSYLASTGINSTVTVNANSQIDVTKYLKDNFYNALSSGNPTLALQTINNVASTINIVNCSSVSTTYCASTLHRIPCTNTPQTCGPCLPGYKGIIGSSNTKCFLANSTTGNIGYSCELDSDCMYNTCDTITKQCSYPIAQCPSSTMNSICSGYGICQYYDNTHTILPTPCTIDNVFCTPKCTCIDGYGGKDCSLDPVARNNRDTGRALLCASLELIKNVSNPSNGLLNSLTNSLLTAYNPDEIFKPNSTTTCDSSLSMLSQLSSQGYLKGDSNNDGLGSTSDYLVQTVSKYIKSANTTGSTGNSSSGSTNGDGSYISSVVSQVTTGIFQSLYNGQYPSDITSDNMRISVSKTLTSNLQDATLAPPLTEAEIAYGIIGSQVNFIGNAASQCDSGNGYAHLAIMAWGTNPYPNSSSIGSPIIRFSNKNPTSLTTATQATNRRRMLAEEAGLVLTQEEEVEQDEAMRYPRRLSTNITTEIPAYYVTMQFATKQNFHTNVTVTQIHENHLNVTFPDCTIYDGAAYVSCGSCNVSSYTNYNVTFVCYDMSQLCPQTASSSSRRLQEYNANEDSEWLMMSLSPWEQYLHSLHDSSFTNEGIHRWLSSSTSTNTTANGMNDDDSSNNAGGSVQLGSPISIQQYAAMFTSIGSVFVSILSSNPFAIHLNEAKMVISFIGSLFVVFVGGCIYFFIWDEFDHNQLIYSSQWPPKEIISIQSLYRKFIKYKKLTKEELEQQEEEIDIQTMIASETASFIKAKPSRKPSNKQYKGLKKLNQLKDHIIAQKQSFEKQLLTDQNRMFTSNISDFFDLVTPDIFQYSNVISFFYLILKQHDFTTSFCNPSTASSRFIRWILMCKEILLGLFIDTLFFQIFYQNTGTCESYTNKLTCLNDINSITGDTTCTWIPSTGIGIGSCALNDPPTTVLFTMLLAFTCVVIGLPIDILLEILVTGYGAHPPDLSKWGMSNEYWFGQSYNGIDLPNNEGIIEDESEVSSNLQLSFQKAEDYLQDYYTTNITSNMSGTHGKDDDFIRYQAYLHTINSNNLMIYYTNTATIQEESEEMLKQVLRHYERLSLTNVNLSELQMNAWREVFYAQSKTILKQIGLKPDGTFRKMTMIERLRYNNLYDKLVKKLKHVQKKTNKLNDELEMISNINKQLQEVILLHKFILEQFSPFKQWLLLDQLRCFECFVKPTVHPLLYLMAWFIVFGILLFFIYWMFAWSTANGKKLVYYWGMNYAIGAIQDIFYVRLAKLLMMYTIATFSIKPQLQSIRYHLHGLAVSNLQGTLPLRKYVIQMMQTSSINHHNHQLDEHNHIHNYNFNLIQHFSPTCRIAWQSNYYHLVMSKLLRQMDDYDIRKCQEINLNPSGLFGFIMIVIPIILFLGGQFLADLVVEVVLPAISSGYVILNAFLLNLTWLYFLLPYIIVIGMIIGYVLFMRWPKKRIRMYYTTTNDNHNHNNNQQLSQIAQMYQYNTLIAKHNHHHNTNTINQLWNDFMYQTNNTVTIVTNNAIETVGSVTSHSKQINKQQQKKKKGKKSSQTSSSIEHTAHTHHHPENLYDRNILYIMYSFLSYLLYESYLACQLWFFQVNTWYNPLYQRYIARYETTRQKNIWKNMNHPNARDVCTYVNHYHGVNNMQQQGVIRITMHDLFPSSPVISSILHTSMTNKQISPSAAAISINKKKMKIIKQREDLQTMLLHDYVMKLPAEIRALSIYPWHTYDYHLQNILYTKYHSDNKKLQLFRQHHQLIDYEEMILTEEKELLKKQCHQLLLHSDDDDDDDMMGNGNDVIIQQSEVTMINNTTTNNNKNDNNNNDYEHEYQLLSLDIIKQQQEKKDNIPNHLILQHPNHLIATSTSEDHCDNNDVEGLLASQQPTSPSSSTIIATTRQQQVKLFSHSSSFRMTPSSSMNSNTNSNNSNPATGFLRRNNSLAMITGGVAIDCNNNATTIMSKYIATHQQLTSIDQALQYMIAYYLQLHFPEYHKNYWEIAKVFLSHAMNTTATSTNTTDINHTLMVSDYMIMLQVLWKVYYPIRRVKDQPIFLTSSSLSLSSPLSKEIIRYLPLSKYEQEIIMQEFYEYCMYMTRNRTRQQQPPQQPADCKLSSSSSILSISSSSEEKGKEVLSSSSSSSSSVEAAAVESVILLLRKDEELVPKEVEVEVATEVVTTVPIVTEDRVDEAETKAEAVVMATEAEDHQTNEDEIDHKEDVKDVIDDADNNMAVKLKMEEKDALSLSPVAVAAATAVDAVSDDEKHNNNVSSVLTNKSTMAATTTAATTTAVNTNILTLPLSDFVTWFITNQQIHSQQ